MRRGLFGSKSSLVVTGLLLGACQTIIGISSYEIDPTLDGDSSGGTPADAEGGKPDGEGGAGNRPSTGGGGAGSGEVGGTPPESEGGAGGGSSVECAKDLDCDDTIDCTADACAEGVCTHTADDALCVPDAGECLSCQLGIGCVAGPVIIEQLLLDPSFDDDSGDWVEDSDNYANITFVEAGAQSGTRIARLGPAPVAATEQEYADLYQIVTIPDGTQSLTLSGYFKLTPGATKPGADYVAAALYELSGGTMPVSQFHSWAGSIGAQATWQGFSYSASRDEVIAMRGNDFTFDLVAHTLGSVYRFDTLSLEATICE
jgi:hypothetical protein